MLWCVDERLDASQAVPCSHRNDALQVLGRGGAGHMEWESPSRGHSLQLILLELLVLNDLEHFVDMGVKLLLFADVAGEIVRQHVRGLIEDVGFAWSCPCAWP